MMRPVLKQLTIGRYNAAVVGWASAHHRPRRPVWWANAHPTVFRTEGKIVFCFAAALMVHNSASAQIRSIETKPPQRDFGYYAGDLFVSTAILEVGADTFLDNGSLPPAGPVSPSIDLRSTQISETRAADGRRITIRTEWQNFSTPDEVSRVDVPGYKLIFTQGRSRLTASIPGFSISVSPFRHDLQPVLDASVLRPDHAVEQADIAKDWRMLFMSGATAVLAGLYLAWRNGVFFNVRRGAAPFARAARDIAQHKQNATEAMLRLHRAFDETAGERVLADDLDSFLIKRIRFAPLRADIEGFFAHSRRIFFESDETASTAQLPSLTRLSRALARAERR